MRAPSAPWVSATRAADTGTRWPSRRSALRVSERPPTSSRLPSRTRSSRRDRTTSTRPRGSSRLGQIDHGRFQASRSTGQKIAGALEVMLSGFTGGQSMIRRIDDDIKAQEFAYMAGRDAVNAKQSAFSAAMQKYQNANAARPLRVSPVKTWSPRSLARSRR